MRVLAINDISCVGRCSLTVTLPIISACGAECNVLPTALLSTHTGGFEGYTFRELTDEIPKILQHWKKLGIRFDFIYSGYLGNLSQIETVLSVKRDFLAENGKFIVDPVMGDDGKLYAGFHADYVAKMRDLCKAADFILPNVTEACFLADMPYPLHAFDENELLARLRALCPRPVLTGVTEGKGVCVVYADEEGKARRYAHENVQGFFCGAGDVFASAFVGALSAKKSEEEAVRLASDFTAAAIRRSAKEGFDKRYGLPFEAEIFSFLKKLNA